MDDGVKLSLIKSSPSLSEDETSSSSSSLSEDSNAKSNPSSSSTSKVEDDFTPSNDAKEGSETPEKPTPSPPSPSSSPSASASSPSSSPSSNDKEQSDDVGAIVTEQQESKKKKKKTSKKKKKSTKKEPKKKSDDKREDKKEKEDVVENVSKTANDDSAAHKTMLKKLVNGAKTGSSSKLKVFIKDFPEHESFLHYGPLLEQANDIITMLVGMLKAPNNVVEALGALFCLTRSPCFADALAATDGGLSATALFVTDTALLPKRKREMADEYGIGVLSNVGHSPDGKKKLVDLLPPPVFERYLRAYYNRPSTIKYAVNVLASVSLVSQKFRKSIVKRPFIRLIARKVIPTSGSDGDVTTVCFWCLRVLALNWRGSVQIRQEGCPTSIFCGLHQCKYTRAAAMHAFPLLVRMFDEWTVDEFHGTYAISVCSKTLATHVKDEEVVLRCMRFLDVMLAEKGFPEEALDSKSFAKNLVKAVRKNASSEQIVQLGLGCVVRCARFSPHMFMGKVAGKKVIRRMVRAVKKAQGSSSLSSSSSSSSSEAISSAVEELSSIYHL